MIRLSTPRLILRPIDKADVQAVFNYRSDAETNRYQGWIPQTIDDVKDFIEKRVSPVFNRQGTWFQLVIIKKAGHELIGDIGLHFFDPENQQVEIGFTLDKKHQKHGYATEAVSEIIRFLFQDLNKHRLTASIDPGNIYSIKLVGKLGLRQEAHFKESIFQNGAWLDDLVYAILRKEWNGGVP
ncbi:MAG: GNAT family protein [Candidatus Marinimicrobia bacterium]|jgi:RimJ/RimL family protein N-acetyltransferase|nr:GNAT family protein [Candidatus Neomarinimicrobiota bacterium]